MPQPVVHWEIASNDAKRLQRFYSDLFDWKVDTNNPMNYGMVDAGAGDRSINGGIMQTQAGMPQYVTFYVHVEDLQKSLDQAARLGAKPMVPPTPIPDTGSFAMFADPDGNLIGLFKPLPQHGAKHA
jgi:predicted enzyme related to lactoylglutathione lyase